MIAKLTGRIDILKPTELIIDVNGVGYEVSIPLSVYEQVINQQEVSLLIYTYLREDQIRLFGFISEGERHLFEILIGVSGIGPAIALAILSGVSGSRLVEAVKTDNADILVKIPGIGKAKAEKIIFEMKRKIKKLGNLASDHKDQPSGAADAVEALMSLGFDEKRCVQAVSQVMSSNPDQSLEAVIKDALKILS